MYDIYNFEATYHFVIFCTVFYSNKYYIKKYISDINYFKYESSLCYVWLTWLYSFKQMWNSKEIVYQQEFLMILLKKRKFKCNDFMYIIGYTLLDDDFDEHEAVLSVPFWSAVIPKELNKMFK